jgi:hypothetical protein
MSHLTLTIRLRLTQSVPDSHERVYLLLIQKYRQPLPTCCKGLTFTCAPVACLFRGGMATSPCDKLSWNDRWTCGSIAGYLIFETREEEEGGKGEDTRMR